jgi:hypothetical protein
MQFIPCERMKGGPGRYAANVEDGVTSQPLMIRVIDERRHDLTIIERVAWPHYHSRHKFGTA